MVFLSRVLQYETNGYTENSLALFFALINVSNGGGSSVGSSGVLLVVVVGGFHLQGDALIDRLF